MLNIWIYSVISVFFVSLVSLVGIFSISLKKNLLHKITLYLVSFSVGGLLGGAFFHLIPEATEKIDFSFLTPLYILSGILLSFVVEKFIHWRHCHHETTEEHPHPFAIMNLVGDGFHNFIDGIIIGSSYLISIELGIATTIAVILHEIPQEIGDFGVLIHGGFSITKALLLNFITALTAFLGLFTSLILVTYTKSIEMFFVPFAAGNFIYIAMTDLIPEIHKESKVSKSFIQFLFIILGIMLMILLRLNE